MHPKIATIVPLKHLNTIVNDEYFMALSHAAGNDGYLNFFRERVEEGKYVILDNSAIEIGEPEAFETYLEKARLMKASEVMLPDFFQESGRTLQEAERCMKLLAKTNFCCNIMVIPQGKTVLEWFANAKALLSIRVLNQDFRSGFWEATTVGISARYTKMFGGNRLDMLWLLSTILPNFQKVHFLGQYIDPRFEARLALEYPVVRVVDSSFPCVYTRHGIKISPEFLNGPRPTREIDFLEDEYDTELLQGNMDMWWNACLNPSE